MRTDRPLTLLHLSDPQFGPRHRFGGTDVDSLFGRLRADFEAMRARHELTPDLVLVTGDLVETGKPSEFRQFRAFAEALAAHFGLPRRRIVLIPGNHDISRAGARSYFDACEDKERPPVLPYWPKLENYAAMFAAFYEGEQDLQFTEAAPYTLFEYPELRLVVAGLDSTIADSHRPEDHHGFLGEPQLRFFAGKLRAFAEQGWFRLAAVHHNPFQTRSSAPDLRDFADLKRILGPHLNLLLHGHVHEEELHWLDNTVPVLGIGSAGVDLQQRPPEVPNQYQWIRLRADRLEFASRAYLPDQKRWIDDLRPDASGAQWWQSRKVTFDNVSAAFTPAPPPSTTSPDAALARSVASYRTLLARKLRHRLLLHDLATFGEDTDIAGAIELLTLFVPPQAAQELPRKDRPAPFRPPDPAFEPPDPLTERAPPRPIDQILASEEHPWILVLGAPGAGKTTLTNWTALKLSADGETLGALPTDLVPVRVDLRLFAEQQSAAHRNGRVLDLFDHLDELHREQSLPLRSDALRALADARRLVWLFDGLDEVADDKHRRAIAETLLNLRHTLGGRGVITGRLVGCSDLQPLFQAGEIDCFTLLDFEPAQIDAFLVRWHALAFPAAPEVGPRRLARLRQTIADVPAVRDLCGNPLLLTLLALLNRGDELPRRRHKLLERAAELMLGQWDANRGIPNGTRFEYGQKRRYLAELAWHMLTELAGGAGNILHADALHTFTERFCVREFSVDPASAATTARALVRHLRERNYVLGLLGGQSFGFLHKAFFEHFAAEEIHHRFRSQKWHLEDLEELFVARWQSPAWKEILYLTCGLVQEDRPEHVVAVLRAIVSSLKRLRALASPELAVFLIRSLAEVRNLHTGPAHDYAIAINELVPAIHQSQESYYGWPIPDSNIGDAYQFAAGHWPGIAESVATATSAQRPGNLPLAWIIAFCSALPPEERRIELIRQIRSGTSSPTLVLVASNRDRWTAEDADHTHQILQDPALPLPERLALAAALLETDPEKYLGDRLPALIRLVASHLSEAEASRLLSALNEPEAMRIRDEALRRIYPLLLRERPHLCLDPHILFRLRPSPPNRDSVAIRALDDALVAYPLACTSHHVALTGEALGSLQILDRFLDAHESTSDDAVRRVSGVIFDWDEGIQHVVEWGRRHQVSADVLELVQVIPSLHRTHRGADEIIRTILDAARGLSGERTEPNWQLIERLRVIPLMLLQPAPRLECIETIQAMYPDHASDVGLTLLEPSLGQKDAEPFLDKAHALLRADTGLRLITLLYFARHLSKPPEFWRCVCDLDPTFEALRKDLQSERDVSRLYFIARRLDNVDPTLPWRPLMHEVFERSTDPNLRFRAAIDLGERDLLVQLHATSPSDPGPRAALDLLDIRDRMLRIGKPRRAIIRVDGTRVGTLTELEASAGTRFVYDREYIATADALPLAPTLPLRPAPYDSPGLHPIFEGLLPQGWLLDIDTRKYTLKPGDQFGLLLATGRDTIGAIEVIPE